MHATFRFDRNLISTSGRGMISQMDIECEHVNGTVVLYKRQLRENSTGRVQLPVTLQTVMTLYDV